jgi:hypothetical protein
VLDLLSAKGWAVSLGYPMATVMVVQKDWLMANGMEVRSVKQMESLKAQTKGSKKGQQTAALKEKNSLTATLRGTLNNAGTMTYQGSTLIGRMCYQGHPMQQSYHAHQTVKESSCLIDKDSHQGQLNLHTNGSVLRLIRLRTSLPNLPSTMDLHHRCVKK